MGAQPPLTRVFRVTTHYLHTCYSVSEKFIARKRRQIICSSQRIVSCFDLPAGKREILHQLHLFRKHSLYRYSLPCPLPFKIGNKVMLFIVNFLYSFSKRKKNCLHKCRSWWLGRGRNEFQRFFPSLRASE